MIIIMDYRVNGNGMDGEFKGNILILETGKYIRLLFTNAVPG